MTLYRTLFLLCLAYLPACASNTTDNSNMSPRLNLETDFLLKRNPRNQTISLIKNNNPTQALYKDASDPTNTSETAVTFLQTYRKDFLLEKPKKEFSIVSNKTDDLGFTRIKLNQSYQGVPVWKGVISMHFNRQHQLHIVRGEYFPTPNSIDISEGLSKDQLFKKAVIINPTLTKINYKLQKLIYHINGTTPRLAYELQPFGRSKLASHTYILDAISGNVLNQTSNIQTLR